MRAALTWLSDGSESVALSSCGLRGRTVSPRSWWLVTSCILAAAVVSCASPSPTRSGDQAQSNPPPPVRTTVILTHVEPAVLTPHRALTGTGSVPSDAIRLFNAALFMADDRAIRSNSTR